jgi:hypothetical protein
MNRRDAIRAVMAMPAVTNISVARLKPDDVIVLECDYSITQQIADNLKTTLNKLWPDNDVLVMANGLRMKIARSSEP